MLKIIKGSTAEEAKRKQQDIAIGLISEATDEDTAIELLIRDRYSISQELALHRKKLMKTVDAAEWNAYTAYVEECIQRARGGGGNE